MSSQAMKRKTGQSGNTKFMGTIARVGSYFRGDRRIMIFGIIFSVISAIVYLQTPIYLGRITTEVYDATVSEHRAINFDYISKVIFLLLVLYLVDSLFNYLSMVVLSKGLQNAIYRIRRDIQAKFQTLPLRYYDSRPYGEILSIVTNDVDAVVTALQQVVIQLFRTLIQLVGVFFMMMITDLQLTLVAVISIPIILIFSKVVLGRIQEYFVGAQKSLGQMNGYLEEQYTGFFVTKLYGKEDRAVKNFEIVNDELTELSDKSSFYSAVMAACIRFVSNLGYVVVAIVGAVILLTNPGRMNIGELQAFIDYTRKFTMPIQQITEMATSIQAAVAAAERIFDFLDGDELAPEHPSSTFVSDEIRGQVDFEHVAFHYNKNRPLIRDLNAHILPGQTVAIVGHTGAGKTTLINLLMRFYSIDGGDIKVDGTSIYDVSAENLRAQIGMVLQDAWLFEGSIRDNIAYGNLEASDEEVISAAKTAYVDHFIRTLPDGYDTMVEEDGGSLSHGQRQLLTIARAVVADPAILILDEATSSVDTRTEVLIQKAMKRVMQGRTSFVIAHRLSTIKDADMIFVMENGDIIEQGNHDTLFALDGKYAQLYNSQFADAQ